MKNESKKKENLGKGIRLRNDGRYEARACVNGVVIDLYGTNLRELKKEFEIAKKNAANDIEVKMSNMTLNEWFNNWFDTYKLPYIKEQSRVTMRCKYTTTFGRLIGDMKISEIKNIDIQNTVSKLVAEGRASSSIRDAYGRVRECLESAKNNHLTKYNPCYDVTIPSTNKQVKYCFLTEGEQNTFLEEAGNSWYKEMFLVMFFTGMRIGEVGGLRWSDVDFEKKCINITHALTCQYSNGIKTMKLTTPKTDNSYRSIPFIGGVGEALLSQKAKVSALKGELGARFRSEGELEDLVFVTTMGSPVSRYNAEREINSIVRSINKRESYCAMIENRPPVEFKKLYPHAIRHTFCSRCFEKGVNPKVIQALLGHKSYSTTMDIYTHLNQDKIIAESEKLNDLFNI